MDEFSLKYEIDKSFFSILTQFHGSHLWEFGTDLKHALHLKYGHLASQKCTHQMKVNIWSGSEEKKSVLQPTYWLFTSTRSFLPNFFPFTARPAPRWLFALDHLSLYFSTLPGSRNKMAGSSSVVKNPNSKAYLSVMVLYGCGRVAALGPEIFICCRPASELCRLRQPIGLKSAFWSVYPRGAANLGLKLALGQEPTDDPFLMQ